MSDQNVREKRGRARFYMIGDGEVPEQALALSPSKAQALRKWRQFVNRRCGQRAADVRVAWSLEWFFKRDGYSAAPDSFLAKETGLQLNNIQRSLKSLEQRGVIIRAHVNINGVFQRRIFAKIEQEHLTSRSTSTPQTRPLTVREHKDSNKYRAHRSARPGPFELAIMDAELKHTKRGGR
jgi:hypothetical protein